MADQNITELPIKTNSGVASTDYMLGIDSAEGYQILVRDVAKYIVENYNGSTIFGSAQTVKNAFAGTLDKMRTFPVNETNGRLEYLNDATFSCANAVREWMLTKGTDAPTTADFWYLHTFAYTKDANNHVANGKQIAYGYGSKASEVYQRTCSSGTWTDWEKQPTRAEITELNSNRLSINVSNAEPISVPFGRYNVALVSGLAQGIGNVCLLVRTYATSLANTIDLVNGGNFSNAALTFEYIDSTKKLKITSTNSSACELDLVYLHKTV